MRAGTGQRGSRGFSLAEVALALGVVAIALVAILAMMPVALDAAAEGRSASRARLIAQALLSDLRAGSFENAFLSAGDRESIPLALSGPGEAYLAFDAEGRGLGRVTRREFEEGVADPAAVYAVHVEASPAAAVDGLALVTLRIGTPAAGAAVNRAEHHVATQIADQR